MTPEAWVGMSAIAVSVIGTVIGFLRQHEKQGQRRHEDYLERFAAIDVSLTRLQTLIEGNGHGGIHSARR